VIGLIIVVCKLKKAVARNEKILMAWHHHYYLGTMLAIQTHPNSLEVDRAEIASTNRDGGS